MAKPGLPKKYAKLGFKKGWRAFKAAKNKVFKKKSPKKTTKTTKTVTVRRPATMAKSKTKSSTKRSRPRFSATKMGNVIVNSSVIAGTMLGSTAAVNTLPWVKNLKSWQKSTAQGIMGLILLFGFKNVWVKKLGAGSIAGGIFNGVLPYLPNAFKMGKSRPLTNAERAALTMNNNMGRPFNLNRQMGKPYEMGRPYSFAGGSDPQPSTSLGRASNRNGRF